MVLNIEQTLGERFSQVFNGPARSLVRPLVYFLRLLLNEREINNFLEEHRALRGLSFLERVLELSNCVDGLICVDLDRLKPSKRERYFGTSGSGRS